MIKRVRDFWRDESGATAVEYGLIVALVFVAAIGAIITMGDSLLDMFGTVGESMQVAPEATQLPTGAE